MNQKVVIPPEEEATRKPAKAHQTEAEWQEGREDFPGWYVHQYEKDYDDPRGFHVRMSVLVTDIGGLSTAVVVTQKTKQPNRRGRPSSQIIHPVSAHTWECQTLPEAIRWCGAVLEQNGYASADEGESAQREDEEQP